MLILDHTSGLYGPAVNAAILNSTMAPVNAAVTPPHHRHIWIITGPAGCGKSTIGRYLAEQLSFPYIEGDEVRAVTL